MGMMDRISYIHATLPAAAEMFRAILLADGSYAVPPQTDDPSWTRWVVCEPNDLVDAYTAAVAGQYHGLRGDDIADCDPAIIKLIEDAGGSVSE